MSRVREYIGARYTTKIYENSLDSSSAEWEANVNYEPFTLVTFNNGSYLSKKDVPASVGNPASNPTYWAQTGFYNGAIITLDNRITNLEIKEVFNTVADMINTAEKDSIVFCRGYNTVNDGGAGYYEINDTGTPNNITILACTSGKIAHLIIDNTMNIKSFGATGDGVTDDTNAFTAAITNCKTVLVPLGSYLITSDITIEKRAIVGLYDGNEPDILPEIILDNAEINVRGNGNAVKNLKLTAATADSGTALHLLPTSDGLSNHVSQSIFENLIINNFQYGIYYAAVVWNCVFTRIRINFCEYALYKNDSFECFGNTFINFYTSGSKRCNISANRFSATFLNGIFGFSVLGAIRLTVNSNVEFIGCNFEADRHLTTAYDPDTYMAMITVSGGCAKFDGCLFSPNSDAGLFVFKGGAGLRLANFSNCTFRMDVSGNLTDAVLPNNTTLSANYGGIHFDRSCTGMKQQITDSAYPLQSTYKPQVIYDFYNGVLNIYNESSADTTKLSSGSIVFDMDANALKYYNGSVFVAI